MKKYSSSGTNKLLIKFLIKSVITTIVSLILFSLLFSEITYKLDLSLETNMIFSIFTVFFCSAFVSFISVLSFKNNGAVMGIISSIPLLIFIIINMIINQNNAVLFIIKLAIIVLTAALFGIFASKRSAKFKVK